MSDFTEKVRAMLDALTTKDWSWSGRTEEPDEDMPEGVFIWHPQGSYLGDTMICLADTYEDDHKDLDFIAAAPTLLREACEREEKFDRVVEAASELLLQRLGYEQASIIGNFENMAILKKYEDIAANNLADALSVLDAKEQS